MDDIINPLEIAAELFIQCRTKEFYDYLENTRGLHRKILDEFKIGYSPPWLPNIISKHQIAPFLSAKLVNTAIGKLCASYGGLYSFPYLTPTGIVGFQFRNIKHDPTDDEGPRYLNLVITKKILYPPYSVQKPTFYALPDYKKYKAVTIVEGPIGMLHCLQAYLPCPIASCGLSLGIEDLIELLQTQDVYLMLDWDTNGSFKMFQLALEFCRIKTKPPKTLTIVEGPWNEGKDPADISHDKLRTVFRLNRYEPKNFVKYWLRKGVDESDKKQLELIDKIEAGKL